jgi:MFS family permease
MDAKRVKHRIDLLGASLMLLVVLTVMLNLTQGAKQGFSSPLSLLLWVIFIVCIIAFRYVEARVESPFVNLALFKNRLFITASIIFAISFFTLFGMHFLLPQFLIRYQGIQPASAGLIIATLSITAFAGRLSDAFGQRWPCAIGMGFVALSGVGMVFWQYSTPSWQVAANLIILGLGIGLTQSPVAAAATLSVKNGQRGVAMGIFNMFRAIGASLGSTMFAIILLSTIVSSSSSSYHLISYIIIGSAIVALLLALKLPGSFPLKVSAFNRR